MFEDGWLYFAARYSKYLFLPSSFALCVVFDERKEPAFRRDTFQGMNPVVRLVLSRELEVMLRPVSLCCGSAHRLSGVMFAKISETKRQEAKHVNENLLHGGRLFGLRFGPGGLAFIRAIGEGGRGRGLIARPPPTWASGHCPWRCAPTDLRTVGLHWQGPLAAEDWRLPHQRSRPGDPHEEAPPPPPDPIPSVGGTFASIAVVLIPWVDPIPTHPSTSLPPPKRTHPPASTGPRSSGPYDLPPYYRRDSDPQPVPRQFLSRCHRRAGAPLRRTTGP